MITPEERERVHARLAALLRANGVRLERDEEGFILLPDSPGRRVQLLPEKRWTLDELVEELREKPDFPFDDAG